LNVAIDPGASGGVAVYDLTHKSVVTYAMPETEGDVVGLIKEIVATAKSLDEPCKVTMEKVGGYAGTAMPGSAMYNFGHGVGVIVGCVMTLGIRLEMITPQAWQKSLSLGTRAKTMSKTDWKNKLKARAQELYPDQKVTLKTADALLILEVARKTPF
jgi:hypothetical protein